MYLLVPCRTTGHCGGGRRRQRAQVKPVTPNMVVMTKDAASESCHQVYPGSVSMFLPGSRLLEPLGVSWELLNLYNLKFVHLCWVNLVNVLEPPTHLDHLQDESQTLFLQELRPGPIWRRTTLTGSSTLTTTLLCSAPPLWRSSWSGTRCWPRSRGIWRLNRWGMKAC